MAVCEGDRCHAGPPDQRTEASDRFDPVPLTSDERNHLMKNECPAALDIKGEHFPCQQMEQMAKGSVGHDGWAHSNRDAEAIWASGLDPVPGMPGWEKFATTDRGASA